MEAQDLKNSILQMAMEGKLVPQDPNDEPASVLLERIKEEKEQLIKEKKIKRNKKESIIFRRNNHFYEKIGKEFICIDEEIPFDIPDSWSWCRLENIVELINGDRGKNYPAKSKLSEISGIPFISAVNLQKGKVSEDNLLFMNQQQYDLLSRGKLRKNDLIFCLRGSIGKNAIFNLEKGAIASSLVILRRYSEDIYLKYLFIYLNSILLNNEIKKYDNGTAQPNLSATNLKKFFVPLPPLVEQERIVEKIEELLPLIQDYGLFEEGLNILNNEFPKKIKDSILLEAIQGKLVPQDPNDEPASVLLERIKEEKEQLIKEKKIKRNKNESFIFKVESHFYEMIGNKEPVCIDDELPFDIPDSWSWCRLENLSSNIHYGFTASAEEIGEVKLLRITDIHENFVDWDVVPYCSISEERFMKYKLMNRDIVMARTGGTIGKSYIIENLSEKAVFASYLIRIIPLKNVYEKYLKLFFETPLFWSQLKDNTQGTGQPNVNAKSLKNLLIPIPPIEEQKRIVMKINELLNNI